MPIENSSKPSANKPITPALSSRFRTTKTPLTPKLIASSPASPATTARKPVQGNLRASPSSRAQPIPLSDNVTPRTGIRSTRITTESPASPPVHRRLSGSSSLQGLNTLARKGSVISSPASVATGQNRLATKASSPNISAARRLSASSSISKQDESTKFIRANDARPPPSVQSPKSTLSPRPLTTSFLKLGSPRGVSSAPSSAIHTKSEASTEPFIRANDVKPRSRPTPALTRTQSNTSAASMNIARTRSPEVLRAQNDLQPRTQPKVKSTGPSSPSKTNTTSAVKSTSPKRQSPSTSSPGVISPPSPSDRRRSFGSSISSSQPIRPPLHKKSASVSSFNHSAAFVTSPPTKSGSFMEQSWMSPHVTITVQHNNMMVPSPETLSPRSASLASSKTVGTSVTSDTDMSELSKQSMPYSVVNQSGHLGHSNQTSHPQSSILAQAQAAAANARRERKVLDLEISNSSLLAINKTLEKELRKQSAELRRFRRLSRSGRLSFAPSNRSVSGQSAVSLDTLQEQTEDDSDYSEDEEKEEESEIEELDDVDMDDSFGDSPAGTTARAKRRARDEQRLMLDLSKHQQLLIDSQKLTQTIRKCLNMSEDLIKEGNQALKYKVGIGDLKMGGRVLTVEDFDANEAHQDSTQPDWIEPRQGLLSPSVALAELEEASFWLMDDQPTKTVDDYTSAYPDPG